MLIDSVREKLKSNGIFHSDASMAGVPTVVGYEKKFKWVWVATQLNTFVIALDLGDEEVTAGRMAALCAAAFAFAKANNKGWPRGLQSGVGAIVAVLSSNITAEAVRYCEDLKFGKKWCGFIVPVVIDSTSGDVHHFKKAPTWGRIYFPYFRETIEKLFK